MKRNAVENCRSNTLPHQARIKLKSRTLKYTILIFEEAKGRGWGRMLTIERDRTLNYSITHKAIFANALSLFEQMFIKYETKSNIIEMSI